MAKKLIFSRLLGKVGYSDSADSAVNEIYHIDWDQIFRAKSVCEFSEDTPSIHVRTLTIFHR